MIILSSVNSMLRIIWKSKTLVFILLLNFSSSVYPQLAKHELKALFLERFTRFIDWPLDDKNDLGDTSFIITIIGKNDLKNVFEYVYKKTKIKKKKVEIKAITSMKKIAFTHILYISESEKGNLSNILSYTSNKPILTISEAEGFAQKGVLINFYQKNQKFKYEINKNAVEKTGLHFSHLLYNLAKIVSD